MLVSAGVDVLPIGAAHARSADSRSHADQAHPPAAARAADTCPADPEMPQCLHKVRHNGAVLRRLQV